MGLIIGIGDGYWKLGFGIKNLDWRLGIGKKGLGIGDWNCDWRLGLGILG